MMRDPSGSYAIERDVESTVQTHCVSDDELARESAARLENREAWQRIIDNDLVEWGRNAAQFDSNEIIPPSPSIIKAACHVAMHLRDEEWAAPLRVVPDGDGGVAFERRVNDCFQSLEITSDGQIELITFHKSQLTRRLQLPNAFEWVR